MDWLDYREKLGIGFNDAKKTKFFMTKMFNVLDSISYEMSSQISSSEYFSFCDMTGTEMYHGLMMGQGYNELIHILRSHSKDLLDFISYYMAFINCQEDNEYKVGTKEKFKNILCNILSDSHIPYELLEENGSYFLFPKGVEEFDNALVSDTLLWLKEYPLTQKAWIDALKSYSESTEEIASEVADKFRKALERFFQEFFNCEKLLEKIITEYGTYLSSKGVPAELSNDFKRLLDAYTKYNNNYAKHHDKVSKNVLEYIMYQTGNLIRLMITLKQS